MAVNDAVYTATFSLIPSFGARTKSFFVPRYRSVVCTDACPREELDLLKLAACSPAHLRAATT
jgi:hypothetical protein